VGQYCVDLCANNPCGNRGTCWVDFTTDPKKPIQKCKNCQEPYSNCGEDKTKQCKNVLLPNNYKSNDSSKCWSNIAKNNSGLFSGFQFTMCTGNSSLTNTCD
jgi:hypothetical protein